MKVKGFTLIELLAVIVILAIIALIATPIIVGIINESRKQSNVRSAELYMSAVSQAIARKNMTTRLVNANCTVELDGNLDCDGVDVLVDVANTKATSGTIILENGVVTSVIDLKIEDNFYNLGSNGEYVLATASSKKACKFVDSNNDNAPSMGEIATCGTEQFYIIESDENDTSMLATNNIEVSNSPKQTSTFSPTSFSENAYWIENSNIKDEYPLVSSLGSFNFYEVYDDNSNITNYLNKYKNYLTGLKYNIKEISLLNNSQATLIGCQVASASCLSGESWVYSTNYWSSVAMNSYIVVVKDDGSVDTAFPNNETDYGIRPVIKISTNDLIAASE